jgi:hypothetical protein
MKKSGVEIVIYNDWKKEKFNDIRAENESLSKKLSGKISAQALRETQKATSIDPGTTREVNQLRDSAQTLRNNLSQYQGEFYKLLGDMADDQLTNEARLQASKNAKHLMNEKIEPLSNKLIGTYQQMASIYKSPVFNSQNQANNHDKLAADAQTALNDLRRSYAGALNARSSVFQAQNSTETRNYHQIVQQHNARIETLYKNTLSENNLIKPVNGGHPTRADAEYAKDENMINGLYVPPRDWTIPTDRDQALQVVANFEKMLFTPSSGGNQRPVDALHDQTGKRVITRQAAVEKLTAYYERFVRPRNSYAPPSSAGENQPTPTSNFN